MFALRRSWEAFRLLGAPKPTAELRTIHRWVSPTMKVLKKRRQQAGPDPPQRRSGFLEWNYDAELYAFGKRLGEEFDDGTLRRALVSRSYAQKAGDECLEDNGALVAEGVEFVSGRLTEKLGEICPKDAIGTVREYLMTVDMLGHVGKHLGLTDVVRSSEFPVEKNTLADAFLAVVAALKQSSGEERAKKFVDDFLVAQLTGKDVYEIWDPKEPYKYLTQLVKERGISAIEPRLCDESAVNTILANYRVGLYGDKKLLGIGWGETVEIAKETAAVDAIRRLNNKSSQFGE